jgi:hypothetical protein
MIDICSKRLTTMLDRPRTVWQWLAVAGCLVFGNVSSNVEARRIRQTFLSLFVDAVPEQSPAGVSGHYSHVNRSFD